MPGGSPRRWRRELWPGRSFAALLSLEDLVDAHPLLNGLVVDELELGRVLHVSDARNFRLEHAMSALEPGQGVGTLLLVPQNAHEHAGMAEVGAGLNSSHGHKTYARILKPLCNPCRQDFVQRLVHPAHSICAHSTSSEVVTPR